jgi:hypothetical protein
MAAFLIRKDGRRLCNHWRYKKKRYKQSKSPSKAPIPLTVVEHSLVAQHQRQVS